MAVPCPSRDARQPRCRRSDWRRDQSPNVSGGTATHSAAAENPNDSPERSLLVQLRRRRRSALSPLSSGTSWHLQSQSQCRRGARTRSSYSPRRLSYSRVGLSDGLPLQRRSSSRVLSPEPASSQFSCRNGPGRSIPPWNQAFLALDSGTLVGTGLCLIICRWPRFDAREFDITRSKVVHRMGARTLFAYFLGRLPKAQRESRPRIRF